MAVLNKEEFFNRIQSRLGDDSSDEAIAFLEDMTDTYNDMETKSNNGGEDWEKKYRENDAAWKKRYANRFYNGSTNYGCGSDNKPDTDDEENNYNPESVTINSLFEGGNKNG